MEFGWAYGVVPQTLIGFYSPHPSRTTVSLFFLQKLAHCAGIEPAISIWTESNRLFGVRANPGPKPTVDCLVQPVGIEPTSRALQAPAMTTSAKVALVPRTRIELVISGYQPLVIPFNYPGI